MEVLFTFFRIISSFSIDILYEISMVNRLFNFDLEKKEVIVKEHKIEGIQGITVYKNKPKDEEIKFLLKKRKKSKIMK